MSTLIVLIVLINGYLFSNFILPLRYKFRRAEGWSAYFFVAAWGMVFWVLAWIAFSLLSCSGCIGRAMASLGVSDSVMNHLMPFDFGTHHEDSVQGREKYNDVRLVFWTVGSMLLSLSCGWLIGLKYRSERRKHASLVKVVKTNPLEEIVLEAALNSSTIKVTMKSRKIYIGWVRKPTLESGKIEFLSVVPLLSGYREKDSHRLRVMTNYHNHYSYRGVYDGTSRLCIDDYKVILPCADIDNISLFDIEAYINFNPRPEEQTPQGALSLN